MFNNIILKINILSFLTGFLTEILSVHPQSPDGDSPGGACGCASLRRHLHCFGFPAGNLADAPVRP